MIYNSNLNDISEYGNEDSKLNLTFNFKVYMIYFLIALLSTRVIIVYYIAPVGIALNLIAIKNKDKLLSMTIWIATVLGYIKSVLV